MRLTFLLTAIAFIIVGNYLFTYMHELTHKVVFSYYGVRSKMHVGIFEGYVVPDQEDLSKLSPQELRELRLLNSIHEIYTYHFSVLYTLLIVFVFALFLLYSRPRSKLSAVRHL